MRTFEIAGSFIDQSVLDKSVALDKALIQFEKCNCKKNKIVTWNPSKTKQKDIKEKLVRLITARQSLIFTDVAKAKKYYV